VLYETNYNALETSDKETATAQLLVLYTGNERSSAIPRKPSIVGNDLKPRRKHREGSRPKPNQKKNLKKQTLPNKSRVF
jgi:hypothetical protein